MKMKQPLRWARISMAGVAAAALVTACGHTEKPSAPAAQSTQPAQAQLASAPQVEPYAIEQNLPTPPPNASKHLHRKLHVTVYDHRTCLTDDYGDRYDACRDAHGNLYPAYYDRRDNHYYPLYYDGDRDRYYSVAEDPEYHRYCRHYIDDPDFERYYDDDVNYAAYQPPYYDRPVIDTPASFHHHDHNDQWLWALPVLAAAVVLLQPHHHHNAPAAPVRTAYSRPVDPIRYVNRNVENVFINNGPVIVNNIERPWTGGRGSRGNTQPQATGMEARRNWTPSAPYRPTTPTVLAAAAVGAGALAAHHVAQNHTGNGMYASAHRQEPAQVARPGAPQRIASRGGGHKPAGIVRTAAVPVGAALAARHSAWMHHTDVKPAPAQNRPARLASARPQPSARPAAYLHRQLPAAQVRSTRKPQTAPAATHNATRQHTAAHATRTVKPIIRQSQTHANRTAAHTGGGRPYSGPPSGRIYAPIRSGRIYRPLPSGKIWRPTAQSPARNSHSAPAHVSRPIVHSAPAHVSRPVVHSAPAHVSAPQRAPAPRPAPAHAGPPPAPAQHNDAHQANGQHHH